MNNSLLQLIQYLSLAALFAPTLAHAQDPIGRIIRTSGNVSAIDLAGAERRLARGSELFIDETVTTGGDASTQMRLSDGSLITINENTQFMVNEYIFDGAGGSDDSVVMSVLEGTMRTITGIIGEGQNDSYALNTPYATIGIRGTEYGVFVDSTGRMRIAVFDGSISVQPAGGGGPTVVGLGGNSDFIAMDDDSNVVELPEAPQDLNVIINTIIEQVDQATLDSLPPAAQALIAANTQNISDADAANQTSIDGQGGTLVDAAGNPLPVQTEAERLAALAILIDSIREASPDFFDEVTIKSVSPNQ